MMLLALSLYLVHPLPVPTATTVVLGPTQSQAGMEPIFYRRPTTVSMSLDGTVAFVVGQSEDHGFDRICVYRNGISENIPLPPKALLSRYFLSVYNEEHGTLGLNRALITEIRNVVASNSKVIHAALSSSVDGAYSSEQEASFEWSSSRWMFEPSNVANGSNLRNLWVAASNSLGIVGFVADQLYLDPASMSRLSPNALDDQAFLNASNRLLQLGTGVITALSGKNVIGYDAHYVPSGVDVTASTDAVIAEEWSRGALMTLGRGIAWSVNAAGDAAGDNRTTLKSVGYPTLWHKGRSLRLSAMHGSAFAIADDGTIVGDEEGGAFIIPGGSLTRRPVLLDSLIGSSGWHIRAAYYISTRGAILALASRGGADHLVLLEPR